MSDKPKQGRWNIPIWLVIIVQIAAVFYGLFTDPGNVIADIVLAITFAALTFYYIVQMRRRIPQANPSYSTVAGALLILALLRASDVFSLFSSAKIMEDYLYGLSVLSLIFALWRTGASQRTQVWARLWPSDEVDASEREPLESEQKQLDQTKLEPLYGEQAKAEQVKGQ